jgi:pimeloyl-ACP methyl ester carboxylesterase
VSVKYEVISFNSENFKIVGELKFPNGAGPHGVVIFVHGDGPNDRTSGGSYPPIMERILRVGYATFAWDKPGTGESVGQLNRGDLFKQRAKIVLDAIEILKKHPDIDNNKIGLWGISQAGYVMPVVLEKSSDIVFMIAVSCPGEASVAQTAYLIRSQALCAGIESDEADKIEYYSEAAERAQTYDQYVQNKSQIDDYPALENMGIKMRVQSEAKWEKPDFRDKYFFDPILIMKKTTIPVLAFFGEKDTQVDPVQGMNAYRVALEQAGNKNFRIELIPGVDHCMTLTRTGCLTEVLNRNQAERINYEPLFLDIVEEWISKL